jgi:Ca2+-binding RTX toxin-like protein
MRALPSTVDTGRLPRRSAIVGVLFLVAFSAQVTLADSAAAAPYSGGFSPTVIGQLADLNGDSLVNGRDDSNAFYGDTHIIDGQLDCDAWATPNDGTGGNGVIDGDDDCTMIGVGGPGSGVPDADPVSDDGVTIEVVDGEFHWNGPLPLVFNAADPDNPDVGDSDFAWSTIDGRVDANGDEVIDEDDCHLGLIGQTVDAGLGDPADGADTLGNDAVNTNPCGFAVPPNDADDGLVDLDSDGAITAADTCTNGCFFRHNVTDGVVQDAPNPPPSPPFIGTFTGTFSPNIITNRADLNGDNVVNGRDDSNAFFGDTHIIDGQLDCDTWGATPNAGTAGSGTITTADDCTLIGVDGTVDGVTITVTDGNFQVATGRLPTVYNAPDPDNPDVGDAQFAWSALNGRVDSSGDEAISVEDCHFGLIGVTVDAGLGDATDGTDILGNDAANTNPCGFASSPSATNNGLVDINSDRNITAADTCAACFFGFEVQNGFVMEPLVATTLDLTPATDTNPEDTNHTVTAHVEDQFGDPLPGVIVRFSVTGAHTRAGSVTTNASGDAVFTYTGPNPGSDTITAYADQNANNVMDGVEPSDTATKTWSPATVPTPPPPPPPGAECPGFAGDPRNDVVGTNGNDSLTGTQGDDIICALGGNDTANGLGGNDLIIAGGGNDTVTGGGGNDRINGQGGRDRLSGSGGNDRIKGQGGNDRLKGGGGTDRLNGGAGTDRCGGGEKVTKCEK